MYTRPRRVAEDHALRSECEGQHASLEALSPVDQHRCGPAAVARLLRRTARVAQAGDEGSPR